MIDYRYHSVSRANVFRESADWFVGQYLLGWKGDTNGKMAAGSAVEKAMWAHLLDPTVNPVPIALAHFDEEMKGEVTKERDDIPALLDQAAQAFKPFGKPLTYQTQVKLAPGERYGLRFGATGYIDFGFDAFDVDMKISWALPSKPKFSHLCQVGTYSELRQNKPQKLAYITPKKFAVYDVSPEDLQLGWRTTLATWKRIETLLTVVDSPIEATRLYPLNLDSFYWPEALKPRAMQAWGI